jgi:glutathionylspermidine synthase
VKSDEDEYAAVPIRTGHPDNEVRLIDVLLRPEVMVFEPLWTVIPATKRFCLCCGRCSRTIRICWIPILR